MPMWTDYERNRYLNAALGGAAYTTTNNYLTPTSTVGTATTAGTEMAAGNGRQAWALSAAASGAGSNAAAINFTNMPAGTVNGVDNYDATSAGNRKAFGQLTTPRTTAAGDTLAIAAGALTVSQV